MKGTEMQDEMSVVRGAWYVTVLGQA